MCFYIGIRPHHHNSLSFWRLFFWNLATSTIRRRHTVYIDAG